MWDGEDEKNQRWGCDGEGAAIPQMIAACERVAPNLSFNSTSCTKAFASLIKNVPEVSESDDEVKSAWAEEQSKMLRSMFRHMYDAIRKEARGAQVPSWLVTLRAKQDAAGCKTATTPDALAKPKPVMTKPSAAAPPASSDKGNTYKVEFDWTAGVAYRKQQGQGSKKMEATTDIYAPAGSKGHNFMWARWSDGYTSEISAITVSAWRGRSVASSGSKAKKANELLVIEAKGITYAAKLHQLDKNNPGVVVKIDGRQKAQLAFKYVPEAEAKKLVTQWVALLAKGAMKVDDLKAKKQEAEEFFTSGWTKKRPAGSGGAASAKRPAAATGDEVGGTADDAAETEDEEEGEEEAEEDGDLEEDGEDDEGDGDEDGDEDEEAEEEEDQGVPAETKADGDDTMGVTLQRKPASAMKAAQVQRKPASAMKAARVMRKPMRRPASAPEVSPEESSEVEQIKPPEMSVFAKMVALQEASSA